MAVATISLLLGFGLGELQSEEAPTPTLVASPQPELESTGADDTQRELERLRAELRQVQQVADRLEGEVSRLSNGAMNSRDPRAHLPIQSIVNDRLKATAAQAGSGTEAQPWFDRVSLVAAGLSASEIEDIQQQWQRYEMDKLYLQDESKRDGTLRGAEYQSRLRELTTQLRDDLGTEDYDAYLYATSQFNRVVINQVLVESPASRAGLKAKDIVVSYADERIFHAGEFKSATSEGEAGAPVLLEVMREGTLYRLSVDRGPLGVRLGRAKEPPLSGW
ncbi:MAG: hypothetical protein ACI9QQ_001475 [Myxococcota bacterium]|jgi:hypothetical protein